MMYDYGKSKESTNTVTVFLSIYQPINCLLKGWVREIELIPVFASNKAPSKLLYR